MGTGVVKVAVGLCPPTPPPQLNHLDWVRRVQLCTRRPPAFPHLIYVFDPFQALCPQPNPSWDVPILCTCSSKKVNFNAVNWKLDKVRSIEIPMLHCAPRLAYLDALPPGILFLSILPMLVHVPYSPSSIFWEQFLHPSCSDFEHL